MQNATNAVLDRIARRHGIKSDYGISKALGKTRQAISGYRRGVSQMDDATVLDAAKLAGDAPEAVLAEIAAERSKSDEAKRRWMHLADLARRDFKAA